MDSSNSVLSRLDASFYLISEPNWLVWADCPSSYKGYGTNSKLSNSNGFRGHSPSRYCPFTNLAPARQEIASLLSMPKGTVSLIRDLQKSLTFDKPTLEAILKDLSKGSLALKTASRTFLTCPSKNATLMDLYFGIFWSINEVELEIEKLTNLLNPEALAKER